MRIFVVNFGKHRVVLSVIGILLVLSIFVSLSTLAVDAIYGEKYLLASAEAELSGKIIILDAGHGGEDSGAVGVNGVLEKDLNLEYTLEIGRMLEEKGYVIVYTRTDDRLLYTEEENVFGIRKISDLKNRCKVGAKYPESIFVSVHMNSFGSARYSGMQVYYSEKNESSRELASRLQDKVKNELQPENNRVIKAGKGMYVLENVENTAVLIECGFLTNEEECKKLSEKEYKKELCFSIVCAIIEYIEGKNES